MILNNVKNKDISTKTVVDDKEFKHLKEKCLFSVNNN